MPKRQLHRQKTLQDETQNETKQSVHSHRRAIRSNLILLPPLVAIGVLGALIGSFHSLGQSTFLGGFVGALLGDLGLVMLVVLVRTRRLLNIQKKGGKSRSDQLLSFFWWTAVLLIAAIVGALLGSMFLPDTFSLLFKILLGVLIGLVGLVILAAIIDDPAHFFAEGVLAFLEGGCCLATVVLFFLIPGTISVLLLWHSLLLDMLTGAGSALVALIVFVGLALLNYTEEVSHGSKTKALTGHSTRQNPIMITAAVKGSPHSLSRSTGAPLA